ncbi:WXG100 family type VII secretion target [Kitasatospora sp. NPDC001095]
MSDGTNFEAIDHSGLKGMVTGAEPSLVLDRGNKLQDAGRVLKELSQALKSHIGNITWEGPAAESFKTWAGNLQQSAELLGNYSAGAGGAMHQAGEALSLAKSAVPDVPTGDIATVNTRKHQGAPDAAAQTLANFTLEGPTPANLDSIMKKRNPGTWVTAAEADAAAQRVYKAHQEAIHQMEKLGQAYAAAATTLNGLGADLALPGTPAPSNQNDSTAISPDGGSGGGAGSGGYVRNPRAGGGSVGGSNPGGGEIYGGGKVLPRDPGSGGPGPSNPGNTPPPPHGGGGQVPPAPQDPGTSIPPYHPSDPVNRPGTDLNSLPPSPTLPTQTGPYGPGGGHLPTDGPTTLPGYPNGPGGSNNGPGIPGGGPVPGFPTGTGGGSVPAKGGGSGFVPNKGGGQIPARTTQFGGGAGQAKGGNPGLPSGTVFGAREAGAGGGRVGGATGMGGGMHPGMGGAHGGAVGAGGGSRARGLSSTTGGTVGGRKGPTAGGEFTPGGTGLRNRAAGAAEGGSLSRQNGMMAPGTAGHGGRNERDRRKRADYLHEDEETWTSGTPHSNPDVVE